MSKKSIAILGSTGSIGTQALEVITAHPDQFDIVVLTAGQNADLLIRQAISCRPKCVVIADENQYPGVLSALAPYGIEVLSGKKGLTEVVQYPEIDMVLAALVGYAGLESVIAAIKAGKDIALANKETLVVAGQLVMELVQQYGVNLLPVDSEHSAIFQCLAGEEKNPIEKIYLTASGGPFRNRDRVFLDSVTPEEALKHPNWVMGRKITIDSASLMNKGLEVIEAKWLFNLETRQIDVIIHPQSIIHSMVQFEDGSMKAQLGLPDMKLPIQYAFSYPARVANGFKRFSFLDYPELTFSQPDVANFRNLGLAYAALEEGGNLPCVLNAANEVAVAAFLNSEISLPRMSDVIAEAMAKTARIAVPSLQDYRDTDAESRRIAKQSVTNYTKIYLI